MSNRNFNGYPPYGAIANNGYFYPAYPQQQYQMPQVAPAPQQAASMQLFAVNGIEGAKAYTVQPSSTVYLMDCDNPIFYIKKSDDQGRSAIQAFSLTEIPLDQVNKSSPIDTSNFATKEDISSLKKEFEAAFLTFSKSTKTEKSTQNKKED